MSARLATAAARGVPTAAKKAPARAGGPVPAERRRSPGQLPILALAALARNPVRSASGALVLVLTMACLWNTLMAQRSRHPAPLFGPPPAAAAAEPQRRADALPSPILAPTSAPIPVPRPDPATVASIAEAADPIGSIIRGADGAKADASKPPAPKPVVSKPVASKPLASRPDAAKPDAAKPDVAKPDVAKPDVAKSDAVKPETTRIAAAQRALARLGYGPLAGDGLMGPGTRAALEKFERDRKLPVTGAIAGRTAKALGIDA